jgi:hypothetical protein
MNGTKRPPRRSATTTVSASDDSSGSGGRAAEHAACAVVQLRELVEDGRRVDGSLPADVVYELDARLDRLERLERAA